MSDRGQCYVRVVFIVFFCFILWRGVEGFIIGSHEAAFLCSTAIQVDG